jgi:hypothetical protein
MRKYGASDHYKTEIGYKKILIKIIMKTNHLVSDDKKRSFSIAKSIKIGIIGLFALQLVYADTRGSGNVDEDRIVVPASRSKNGIGNMLMQSISLIGIPYRWGGNTPETGMDCSAFIRYVFKKSMGISLPRTSAEIAKRGIKIHINELEPGDLIFFNTKRGANTHLGMYIGDNKFIQSPRTGQNIQITELSGYYRANYNGAKRIVQENEDEEGITTIESYHEINDQRLTGGSSRAASRKKSSKKRKASIAGKQSKKTSNVTKATSKKHRSSTAKSKNPQKSKITKNTKQKAEVITTKKLTSAKAATKNNFQTKAVVKPAVKRSSKAQQQ